MLIPFATRANNPTPSTSNVHIHRTPTDQSSVKHSGIQHVAPFVDAAAAIKPRPRLQPFTPQLLYDNLQKKETHCVSS